MGGFPYIEGGGVGFEKKTIRLWKLVYILVTTYLLQKRWCRGWVGVAVWFFVVLVRNPYHYIVIYSYILLFIVDHTLQ